MSTQTVQLTGGFDGTVTMNPGLVSGATSQTAVGSGNVGSKQASGTPCVSHTGITYTGATATFSGSGSYGTVTGAIGTGTSTIQVQWFIGSTQADTSTIDVNIQTNGLGLTVLTFNVHGGQLDGATATAQLTAMDPIGTAPITSVRFAGTVDFMR